MAASTLTFDTGEWVYLDVYGVGHTVTDGQTFSMTVTDTSATDVQYSFTQGQAAITTTDGYKLTLRPRVGTSNSGNMITYIGPVTDAGQGSNFYSVRGEIRIECPVSGVIQNWSVATINPSDADFDSAGTIIMTLEDQFGHVMVMPATGSGITVAQAA